MYADVMISRHRVAGEYAAAVTARTLMLICLLGVGLIVGCADTRKAVSDEQLDCLALALYWEARGDGRRGMTAVGWTVLNRVDSPKFPATPCAVVQLSLIHI